MKIYDISLTLSPNLTTSPNEDFFHLEFVKRFAHNQVNLSKLTLGNHNGTHIDAPFHFVEDGKTVEKVDPEKLIGPCQVLEVAPKTNLIEKSDIEGKIKSKRILFKTSNSALLDKPFTSNYVSIGLSSAQYLAGLKTELVGIDYFGCEAKGSPGHPVHTVLLKSDVVIVEGINLLEVEPGEYEIFVGALKIAAAEATPARVFLIKN